MLLVHVDARSVHKPKLILSGKHNMQTFKHNTLINKLLLIINIPLTVGLLLMLFFVQSLSGKSVIYYQAL